jgi:hypothetical protein
VVAFCIRAYAYFIHYCARRSEHFHVPETLFDALVLWFYANASVSLRCRLRCVFAAQSHRLARASLEESCCIGQLGDACLCSRFHCCDTSDANLKLIVIKQCVCVCKLKSPSQYSPQQQVCILQVNRDILEHAATEIVFFCNHGRHRMRNVSFTFAFNLVSSTLPLGVLAKGSG